MCQRPDHGKPFGKSRLQNPHPLSPSPGGGWKGDGRGGQGVRIQFNRVNRGDPTD